MQKILEVGKPSEYQMDENEEPPSGGLVEPPPYNPSTPLPDILTYPHISPIIKPLRHSFRSSPVARAFRKRFFPLAGEKEWNDWHWQIANRIKTLEQVDQMLHLSPEERDALGEHSTGLPFSVTPYYMILPRRCGEALSLPFTRIFEGRGRLTIPLAKRARARFRAWCTVIRTGCCFC